MMMEKREGGDAWQQSGEVAAERYTRVSIFPPNHTSFPVLPSFETIPPQVAMAFLCFVACAANSPRILARLSSSTTLNMSEVSTPI